MKSQFAIPNAQSGATGGEELSSKQVSQLPLNKRDFSQLLLLAAGTMTDANGATNFTQQFAINGQRGVEATFAMDGADISDPEMGGSTFSNFNVDAVQEIQSSSGWMPAEIGRGASGFTNIVTRSRRQWISRIDLRVCAQLRLRCAQLFRSSDAGLSGKNSTISPQRVWFHQRRPGFYSRSLRRPQPDFLFHPIPGIPASARNYTGDAGADRGGAHRTSTR